MRKIVEYISKNGKDWIKISEWIEPEGTIFMPSKEYLEYRLCLTASGYKYFKVVTEEEVLGEEKS